MSQLKIQACSLVLKEHFGSAVESVGEELLKCQTRNLSQLVKNTGLSLSKVKEALRVLFHHNLVEYKPHAKGYVEYSIISDRVLHMIRFPCYAYCARTLYGEEGEIIVEEILHTGRACMSEVVRKVLERLQGSTKPETVKSKFIDLVETHFLRRVPYPDPSGDANAKVPSLILPDHETYRIPEIKLYLLSKVKREKEDPDEPPSKRIKVEETQMQPDQGIYWRVNYERFHTFMRDQMLVEAMERRVEVRGSEVIRAILRLGEKKGSAPKETFTPPVSRQEIFEILKKEISITQQELDSYLQVITEDVNDFVIKTEERGGMFRIDMQRVLRKLAEAHIVSVVQDRFGVKACRIFRLLLEKKFIEQKQIEELAMIPARDAKELTYKMFQEKFIMTKELPRTPDYAPSRMIYLFYADLCQVSQMLLEWCYKAIANSILRRAHVLQENKRVLDKQQRVDVIVASMEQSNAEPDQIEEVKEMVTPPERRELAYVKHITTKMELCEAQLDETIFVLQMFVDSLCK
uniref:DNA-directed RNA polymerase III subunit RPC3 n=1 Tax=Ornithodoros turicata TaxID=34597 RepID=A0A2R5LIS0_9ACAR